MGQPQLLFCDITVAVRIVEDLANQADRHVWICAAKNSLKGCVQGK